MNSLLSPGAIEKIQQLALEAEGFAFLLIDHQGSLLDKGGELASFSIPQWEPGENILDSALFLHGYLPLSTDHESIICYQLSDDCVIDIHLFREDCGTLILMLDRSADTEEVARLRQQENEQSLRRRYHKPRDS